MKKRILSIVLLIIPIVGYPQVLKNIAKAAIGSGVKSIIHPPINSYLPSGNSVSSAAVDAALGRGLPNITILPNEENKKTVLQLPSPSNHTNKPSEGASSKAATRSKPIVVDSHPLIESEFLADGALERNGFRITYSDSTYVKFVGAAYGISNEARFSLDKNTMDLTVLIPISSNLDDAVEVYDYLNNKLSQDFNGSSVDYKLRNTMPVEDYYTLYICPSGAGGVYIQNRSIENYYAVRLVFKPMRTN